MNKMNYIKMTLIAVTFSFCGNTSYSQTASTTISPTFIVNNNSKPLLGITMDARTGMMGNSGSVGYFNSTGNLIPNIDTLFNDFPLNGVRYPGQAIMVGFEWKKSIGTGTRPIQTLLGTLGPGQSVDFGFDEFMDYCESRGLNGADIQIMIPIYDSLITYGKAAQDSARVPYPAQNAADWVEYANCPDTANWGGGVAWGAQRAANGHPSPYNIKTWNIGNEPWGSAEYGFTSSTFVNNYFNDVTPIIDSMLARDTTIHITISTTGNAYSHWNKGVRDYKRLNGKVYGISPHFFSDMQNVDNIESTLSLIIDSANAAGLKVILGDFSHEINNGMSTTEKNQAMSWKGVNFTTDMLLMFSQQNTIERADHWLFGMTNSTWRPIRKETSGIYTLLPVGKFYKMISPYFQKNSLYSVSTSPIASDGHPYSLRASAFSNATNDTITVIALNRDSINSLIYTVNGLSSFNLFNAKILTADSLHGEIIYSNNLAPDINGNFTLPASSILLLSYTSSLTSVNQIDKNADQITVFPNPFSTETVLKTNFFLKNAKISILNSLGMEVFQINNVHGQSVIIKQNNLHSGIYYITIIQENKNLTTKIIITN